MTVYDKLKQEFGCAIVAILGDEADKSWNEFEISKAEIEAISNKVKFYLDL